DIHEDVAGLRRALDSLARAGADPIVSLGDLCKDGARLAETCRLLDEAGVVGVWGNHDYGLCTSPLERLSLHFDVGGIGSMRRFTATLVIGDCWFSHIEPGLDPEDLGDLWRDPGPPVDSGRLNRIWAAVPQPRMFMGHLHRWFAATPAGPSEWRGEGRLRLPRGRSSLVVVGAVCDGCWALYDAKADELIPNV